MDDVDTFLPLWASAPGRTIRKRLDEIGLDVTQFAKQLGTSALVADGLITGRQTITADIAMRLSQLLGASTEFWISRDYQYRGDLARVETDRWLNELPVQDMTNLGWISPGNDWPSKVSACLSFFGVQDLEGWHQTYDPMLSSSLMRISTKVPSRQLAIAAWLRRATCEGEAIPVASWDSSALRGSLGAVRKLTRRKDPKDFLPRLRDLLARSGVALVVLRSLSGCPASGAAHFLAPDRAMIVVSGRFLADDQFWFTVMHEIGHLLLHGPGRTIVDDPYSVEKQESPEEDEANRFAANTLFPSSVRAQIPHGRLMHRDIISLALAAGISPGIVVGQLQFENRLAKSQMNKLKRRYRWDGSNLEIS